MEIKASRILKIVYCLVLLGSFFIAWPMASSSWVGLATGLAFRGGILLRIALFLIFALRIISVVFNPKALDVYATGVLSKGVRALGIFLMWVGLAAITAMFFIKPITLILFRGSGEYAIGAFAVGMYLVFIAPSGIIGVVVFEIVRLWGAYIRKNRSKLPTSGTSLSEETEKRKTPLLEKLSIALTILIALIFIINSQKERVMQFVFFSNNTEMTKRLVTIGSDVNKKNISGYSSLHHAASRGDKGLVELLIAKGANVNTQDRWGVTPLHCICEGFRTKDEEAIASRSRDNGAGGLDCQLGTKNEEAKIEVAKVLIAHGADVNKASSSGTTPLHAAAYLNKLEMAKLLVAHGADVSAVATRIWGYTPLHMASKYGSKEVVQFLLTRVDVNVRDAHGFTPLHVAVGRREGIDDDNSEVVDILIAHGADVNAKTKDDFTPLHYAAAHSSLNTMKILLAHHADVNAKSQHGTTPLHYAAGARADNIKNIELLIKSGALINQKDANNKTALDIANYYGYKEKANLLLLHDEN